MTGTPLWHPSRAVLSLVLMLVAATSWSVELPSAVVDSSWLEEHLDAADLRVVDVRERITDYWLGHLPGAVYLNAEALRMSDHGVPVMLLEPGLLAEKLGTMGITPDDTVVVYTETGDYKAPFLTWALDYIGHESSGVLEGGFDKWESEGRLVTQDYPSVAPTKYPMPTALNDAVRAHLDEVHKARNDENTARVDVRPTPLYTGERGFWKRNGHIPGFRGRFWGDDLQPDGTWKPVDELREAYADLGVTPEKHVVVMCGQGLMSAHAYFTLKYVLGFPSVTNYDGGFHEWVADDALPVATGSE